MIWSVAVVSVAVLFSFYALFRNPPEPSYQGRMLSDWLNPDVPASLEATNAVRAMGTNIIPTCIAWLNEVGPFRRSVFGPPGFQNMEEFVPVHVLDTRAARSEAHETHLHHIVAMNAILALGPLGSNALPGLLKIAKTADKDSVESVTHMIIAMGTTAESAVPGLLEIAEQSPEWERRRLMLFVLGRLKLRTNVVIPRLISLLKSAPDDYRYDVEGALRECLTSPAATPSEPRNN